MNRVVKTFLLWLLVIAIPAQGIAAAANASCGPNHHALTVTHAADDSIANEAKHAGGHHDHDPHASIVSGADAESASAKSTPMAHTVCGTCATCCVGSLVPPSDMGTSLVHNDVAFAVPHEILPPGFIPAGPERPPRVIFA